MPSKEFSYKMSKFVAPSLKINFQPSAIQNSKFFKAPIIRRSLKPGNDRRTLIPTQHKKRVSSLRLLTTLIETDKHQINIHQLFIELAPILKATMKWEI